MPTPDLPSVDKPIELTDSTLPPTLTAALRYTISLTGTYLVAKGYVDAANVEGILTVIVTVVTVAYGIYRTRENRAKLIVTAAAAPNSVAVVTAS